jgi:glycosyltransferase involved in cell wall biosynthesis
MPRLLNLNSYHYRRGGADVVYLDHAALFAAEGWSNAFMAMHHPDNLDSEWSPYFVDELQHGHNYGALEKARMAVKVVYSLEAKRKAQRLVRDFLPDVAHAHNLYHHLSPSVLAALSEAGVPTVMTAHDYKLACPAHEMLLDGKVCERCKGGRYVHCLTNRCIKGSTALSGLVMVESAVHAWMGSYVNHLARIVVPSQFMGRKLVEWGIPERLVHHVPNAVNPAAFAPSADVGDYFVYFGRLAESKGVRTLVKAAHDAGVKLVLVGTGDLEAELARAADGDRLQVLGRRSGNALWDVVARSRAVVLPSEWYENAPMSILEAYALGKPVLAADIGGIPEMILPGQTGWLFPSADVSALAAMLQTVAAMPAGALLTMGRAARAHLEADYAHATYLTRMKSLYRELGVTC